jgi:hypothetical protein
MNDTKVKKSIYLTKKNDTKIERFSKDFSLDYSATVNYLIGRLYLKE